MILCAATALMSLKGEHDHILHKFQLWGTFDDLEKTDFYIGFTNGLITGSVATGVSPQSKLTPGMKLMSCLITDSGNPSRVQAIAMIDKYYKENPAKWDMLIGDAIVEALIVKDGPCGR